MTDPGPAAYSPYDVLRTLIERVGWPSETEKRLCLESIALWESMAIFGNLAQMMTCKHELPRAPDSSGYFSGQRYGNRCVHCGKGM